MAKTQQQLVRVGSQVYEPEFNIETNEYYDKMAHFVRYGRNQQKYICPCNNEEFDNHSTFHKHIKTDKPKSCHQLWLRNRGEKNPQMIIKTRELLESQARNTKLDIKISTLQNENARVLGQLSEEKQENESLRLEVSTLKESEGTIIERLKQENASLTRTIKKCKRKIQIEIQEKALLQSRIDNFQGLSDEEEDEE